MVVVVGSDPEQRPNKLCELASSIRLPLSFNLFVCSSRTEAGLAGRQPAGHLQTS